MSPSSSGSLFAMQRSTLSILAFILLISVVCAQCCDHQQFSDAFFSSARVFTTTPEEGITLLSANLVTDIYLINGETDEIIYNYAFMPPSGASPTDYNMSFSCDNLLVYNASSSCTIINTETAIEGSTDTAYNTTVTCSFNSFPGTALCTLYATLDLTSVTAASAGTFSPTPSLSRSPAFLPIPPPIPNIRFFDINSSTVRQSSQYSSPIVTANVYGYVFYVPDSNGELSINATLVSGSGNSYRLELYDRTNANVRLIRSFGFVPGDVSTRGSAGLNFFQSATISTASSDIIFRYDVTSCSLTGGASLQDGEFNLTDEENCGIGIAVEDEESYPTLGVQFRPYKSGNFTLELNWLSLGTSDEEYEQILVFEIVEVAPPIIDNVTKLDEYHSTPCESETLSMTIANVQQATTRRLVVYNEDGSETIWMEIQSLFSYNSVLDSSTIVFESAGGSGTNVPFDVFAEFDNEFRNAIVFNDTSNFTLSFTSPPSLTSMSPTTAQLSGGETIMLLGSFDGFGDSNDFVFVGGLAIPSSQLNISEDSEIRFTAPAQSLLGEQYAYNVTVFVCAERSNSVRLSYIVEPLVTITPLDTSYNETSSSYVIPLNASATFIAQVSGNNEGIVYSWAIFDSSGTELLLTNLITNAQLLILPSDLLSSSDTYSLSATVINLLNLTDTAEIRLQLAESNADYIVVNVFPLEPLSRSVNTPTLVQSSVLSSSGSELTFVWQYDDTSYIVSDNTSVTAQAFANSSNTGPTRLGLEFNIARRDLQIGNTTLSLTVTLDSDATVSGSDNITIEVLPSDLQATINDGINGTLVQSGNDIELSGAKSRDPDVLSEEGDSSEGLTYLWNFCSKSLDLNFLSEKENCSSIFPGDNTGETIIISSESLISERLDNGSNPAPTFYSFGLQVSKDDRVSYAFLYFEFRTVTTIERVPSLSSVDVIDRKGSILGNTGLSTASDIIIRPTADESIVLWTYDMALPRQKYLFSRAGVLITGPGYMSVRSQKSRLPMGFTAGSLEPATEYKVLIVASANDTSLETSYQISFKTADIPRLTCSGPSVDEGIVSETVLQISAELTYETQSIEYCFYLVSEERERFSVGKGCSSVAFASFVFPRRGIFDVECLAKTVSGAVIQNVTLDTNITLSLPELEPGLSEIEILSRRLATLTAEADRCEILRDHSCLKSLILAANEISVQIEEAAASDNSEEAVQLLETTKEFIQRLSALSEELAANTVYRPNQVEESIDETFYLTTVPGTLISDENVFYSALSQMDGVIEATKGSDSPAVGNDLVNKVIATINVTLTNAYILGQGGTTRRRLLQSSKELTTYADLLIRGLEYVGQIRKQQEGCGFVGLETTVYPESLNLNRRLLSSQSVLKPFELDIIIACDVEQIQEQLGRAAKGEICEDVVRESVSGRVEGVLVTLPTNNVLVTGMVSGVDPYTSQMVYAWITGVDILPIGCLNLILQRDPTKLTVNENDNLTSGILSPYTTSTGRGCTQATCFNLSTSQEDEVIFSSSTVTIRTAQQGIIVAGNVTRASSAIFVTSIEGEGTTGIGETARIIGIVISFAAVTGMITWIAVTRSVVTYPEVDDIGWEYVERDMFGRGSVDMASFSPVADTTPGSGVGTTFTTMAKKQSMERRVSPRGGSTIVG